MISGVVLAFIAIFTVRFLVDLYKASESDDHRRKFGSPPDEAYCREWSSYYENFCTVYPGQCNGGPRKLARCVQGWDKQ